jgi:hypothetical protein
MADDKRDDAERIYLFVQHLGRRLRDFDREVGMSQRRFSALAGLAFEAGDDATHLTRQNALCTAVYEDLALVA